MFAKRPIIASFDEDSELFRLVKKKTWTNCLSG